jgi:integrase/recombinase XerD
MEKRQLTVEAILWEHSTNKDGLHPVKIKVTYDRKTKYYPVAIEGNKAYSTPSNWDTINRKDVRGKNKAIKEAIERDKSKAREAFNGLTANKRSFTFERFNKEYVLNTSSKGYIKFFDDYLGEILKEGRAGTYHTYHCALQAFKAFRGGRDLDPLDITVDLLKDFEGYLKKEKPFTTKKGKKIIHKAGKTTISIYMRALRAVYNYIAGKMPHLRDHYPFTVHQSDRSKYKIKSGSGSKGDALTIEQLQKFMELEFIASSPEWRAQNLWLFSFYCNGMNFSDMARLKYVNFKKDSIQYVRQKTKETEGNEEAIEIPLTDAIRSIVVELGNTEKKSGNYVFDLLEPGLSAIDQRKTVNQKIKIVNKWLKRICSANDLPSMTTYWARHTYASLLKQSGQSVELIREMLGHSDIKTTESYLKRFDLAKKREANESIQTLMKKSA